LEILKNVGGVEEMLGGVRRKTRKWCRKQLPSNILTDLSSWAFKNKILESFFEIKMNGPKFVKK